MLKWLLGGRPIASPLTPDVTPSQPIRLPLDADGNPLHRLFDAWQLPWREPRAIVEAREGYAMISYTMTTPCLSARRCNRPGCCSRGTRGFFERYAPTLPIAQFSAITWICDDAAANLREIAFYMAQWIGPAPIGPEYNTDVCRWQAGPAALQLMTWPPERQSHDLSNSAYDREPRLRTAVRLTATTGFRLPLSTQEDAWIRAFRPVAAVALSGW